MFFVEVFVVGFWVIGMSIVGLLVLIVSSGRCGIGFLGCRSFSEASFWF